MSLRTNRGNRVRLWPSAARLYPGLDPAAWYPVVEQEPLGVFLEIAGRRTFVFGQFVEMEPEAGANSR